RCAKEGSGIHPDRVTRRHSDHCHPGRHSLPGVCPGERESSHDELPLQHEADRHGADDVCPGLGPDLSPHPVPGLRLRLEECDRALRQESRDPRLSLQPEIEDMSPRSDPQIKPGHRPDVPVCRGWASEPTRSMPISYAMNSCATSWYPADGAGGK